MDVPRAALDESRDTPQLPTQGMLTPSPLRSPQRGDGLGAAALPMTPSQGATSWSSTPATPGAELSPRVYDRSRQVGLGELTTPRWHMAHRTSDALTSPSAGAAAARAGAAAAPSSGMWSALPISQNPVPVTPPSDMGARQARATSYTRTGPPSESLSSRPSFASTQQLHEPSPLAAEQWHAAPAAAETSATLESPSAASSAAPTHASPGARSSRAHVAQCSFSSAAPLAPTSGANPWHTSSVVRESDARFMSFGSTDDAMRQLDELNLGSAPGAVHDVSTPPRRTLFPDPPAANDSDLAVPSARVRKSLISTPGHSPMMAHGMLHTSDTDSLLSRADTEAGPRTSRLPDVDQRSSRVVEASPQLSALRHQLREASPRVEVPSTPQTMPPADEAAKASPAASSPHVPPPMPKSPLRLGRPPRSPRRRATQSAQPASDEADDSSSSLAGRLSRRSLIALSSLFKSSPRRSVIGRHDAHEAADNEDEPAPPSRSRLSFTRRRRQSVSGGKSPQATRPVDAAVPAVPAVPSPGRDASAVPSPGGTAAPLEAAAPPGPPQLPPKSSRREGADHVAPLATEPPAARASPYYTAKAQGSRIPRASSMMRLLTRRAGSTDEAPRLPSSASAHSIATVSDVTPALPTSTSFQRARPVRRASPTKRPERSGTMERKAAAPSASSDEGRPVRVRTFRRSQATSEAADALRRQRAAAEREAPTNMAGVGAGAPAAGDVPVESQRMPSAQSRRARAVDDVQLADEEMERHIARVQRRKLAAGARQEDLDQQLAFPVPGAPSKRLSPRQAEVIYGNHLCPYEAHELHEYESIYYVGSKARHKHYAVPEKPELNYGYDDERGDYVVNLRDHLAYRYEIVKLLGRGSFGQVLQCRDHKTGRYVAIKLIRNKRRFHHQALVEVKIMEHLTRADPDEQHYVVHMTDSFTFRSHLCVTMELLSINLYELIKANSFEGFSTTLIRRFTQQTLTCLALMRQSHIVHCDLKPENILLANPRRSEIRVIDFGSSCFENEKGTSPRVPLMTVYTYIQSRFYRSPEVILGIDYSMGTPPARPSHSDRHVEPRVHPRRAAHGLSHLPRRKRAGPARVHDGGAGRAGPPPAREEHTPQAVL